MTLTVIWFWLKTWSKEAVSHIFLSSFLVELYLGKAMATYAKLQQWKKEMKC